MKMIQIVFSGLMIIFMALSSGMYAVNSDAYNIIDAQTEAELAEMLQGANLNLNSLNYEKDWDLSSRMKRTWHMNALQQPLKGAKQVGELRRICADGSDAGMAATLNHFMNIAFCDADLMDSYLEAYWQYQLKFTASVKQPKDIFRFWEDVLNELNPLLGSFSQSQWQTHKDSLGAYIFAAFAESEDKEKYEKLLQQKKLPDAPNWEADELQKQLSFSYNNAALAAIKYLAASQVLREAAGKLKYTNKKAIYKSTRYGTMIIGSRGNDSYNQTTNKQLKGKRICLLIEPSGTDTYELNLYANYLHNSYLLIDYSGDDVYRNYEPGGMFFSSMGVGISYDLSGDDTYLTDDFAFSAFKGINLHVDYVGADNYRSGLFSQGAAMQGIGMLVDMEGNDTYNATTMAQGLGSVGGIGAMLDYSGADTYILGGKYTHAPLMPDDYRSMGQGMGFGFRPDFAGGLGLVYDKAGNDKYLGGVYAQGVGYWYATGVLIDEAGNDVYNAVYYPQGSGIHLASGFLYDGGGNDTYYSRNGPGQGAGHDWGMGMLIDNSGNDAYSIHGGNGLGLSNSVGIFVDKSGDDRYERNEAQNYGNAAFARSTGGIGLFLDMGGKDLYSDSSKADNSNWEKGTYGFGRDIELGEVAVATEAAKTSDDPLIAIDAPIAEVFAAAAEWEVGSAVNRVREARKVLVDRQQEALPYIIANKLDGRSGLEYRALEAFLDKVPDFKDSLFNYVEASDSLKAKTAMSLIAGVGDSTLIVPIKRHLEAKRYITACISLLGSIKSDESIEILNTYAFHSSERYRYIVARSLMQIDKPKAKEVLKSMSNDESFLVQALLRNLPKE